MDVGTYHWTLGMLNFRGAPAVVVGEGACGGVTGSGCGVFFGDRRLNTLHEATASLLASMQYACGDGDADGPRSLIMFG